MNTPTHDEPSGDLMIPPARADLVRHEFAGTEMEVRRETSAQVLGERVKAEVAGRYQMALHRPRDVDHARQRLLRHCKRPRFAEKARYHLPFGENKASGPTIRFVEAALQEFGNVMSSALVTFESEDERHVRVLLTDLERNITHEAEVVVRKFVERKRLRQGQKAISSRTNSQGETVFLVRAEDVDLLRMQGAAVSKAVRTLGLRILPADIVEEGQELCMATLEAGDKDHPDAAKRRVLDSFEQQGILARDVAEYLGHSLEQVTPAQLGELRGVYAALRDGEASWRELVLLARQQRGEVELDEKAGAASAKLKAKLDERKKGGAKKAEPEQKPAAAAATTAEPPKEGA